jgi:hypothetical protein
VLVHQRDRPDERTYVLREVEGMVMHKIALLVVLPVVAFALAGCSQWFAGGGWMDSVEGDGNKATFGFEFDNRDYKGQMTGTYHDLAAGVAVRFDGVVWANTLPGPDNQMQAKVRYVQQGPRQCGDTRPNGTMTEACTGWVWVEAEDNGEPGVSEGDQFYIKFLSGVFEGYENGGNLGGGNLQALDE